MLRTEHEAPVACGAHRHVAPHIEQPDLPHNWKLASRRATLTTRLTTERWRGTPEY
jgi:hypothetical protein